MNHHFENSSQHHATMLIMGERELCWVKNKCITIPMYVRFFPNESEGGGGRWGAVGYKPHDEDNEFVEDVLWALEQK